MVSKPSLRLSFCTRESRGLQNRRLKSIRGLLRPRTWCNLCGIVFDQVSGSRTADMPGENVVLPSSESGSSTSVCDDTLLASNSGRVCAGDRGTWSSQANVFGTMWLCGLRGLRVMHRLYGAPSICIGHPR